MGIIKTNQMSEETAATLWSDDFIKPDGTVKYWVPVMSVFVMQTINFIFCQIVKDNSHIDTLWSISFILPNGIMIAVLHENGTKLDLRTLMANGLLVLWGLRLAVHIGLRH